MKLIVLDRDGVINRDSDDYIRQPGQWQPIDGSLAAIARFTGSGWRVVIASNQSGIARGLFDMAALSAIHARMHKAVSQAGGRIDAIFFCPELPDAGSPFRKPNPGMLLAIGERFNVDPAEAPMVGDTLADLQAAAAAGAPPILVLTGKGEAARSTGGLPPGTAIHADLAAVAQALCP